MRRSPAARLKVSQRLLARGAVETVGCETLLQRFNFHRWDEADIGREAGEVRFRPDADRPAPSRRSRNGNSTRSGSRVWWASEASSHQFKIFGMTARCASRVMKARIACVRGYVVRH